MRVSGVLSLGSFFFNDIIEVHETMMAGETQIGWWGYGSSSLAPTAPVDIWPILAGCLNGDFPRTESACPAPLGAFQRSWAANENWLSGPALAESRALTMMRSVVLHPHHSPEAHVCDGPDQETRKAFPISPKNGQC